jgi:hypothetical protein
MPRGQKRSQCYRSSGQLESVTQIFSTSKSVLYSSCSGIKQQNLGPELLTLSDQASVVPSQYLLTLFIVEISVQLNRLATCVLENNI